LPPQSAAVAHCAQLEVAALQIGRVAGHCELAVQPVRHLSSCGSQIGAAAPQSLLERQATHWPSLTLQRGAVAGQCESCAHCTQAAWTLSQIGRVAGQSVFELQPTHAPDAVLQRGVVFPHEPGPVHS
jgi:hypothetical protein